MVKYIFEISNFKEGAKSSDGRYINVCAARANELYILLLYTHEAAKMHTAAKAVKCQVPNHIVNVKLRQVEQSYCFKRNFISEYVYSLFHVLYYTCTVNYN